ncbi:MAG: serine/threonine protein kinase [Tabrizicola sp.]|jgi:hypothetical protein|nr:serine/threonine protein kinase [Tabrizicola sp.]
MAFDVSDALNSVDCIDELMPGTALLNDQYRVTRFLASGGFGITYVAKDALDRDIALKECFVEAFCKRSQARVVTRSEHHRALLQRALGDFRQEARVLARMSHPNIVRIRQYFEENDTAYMALDFVHGHDLFEIIDEKRMFLTMGQVVDMARKLLSAVATVHANGYVHCDISPDNISVTRMGEPVLLDFGSARPLVDGMAPRHSEFTCVKDGYSPHELYETAGACGAYSDIYALAATLYYVITGRVPVDSSTRLRTILNDKPDPLKPLAGSVAGYPRAFLASIDRALSVEPSARFQSVEAWMQAMDGVEAGEAGVPQPTHPATPLRCLANRDRGAADRTVVLMRRATPQAASRQAI